MLTEEGLPDYIKEIVNQFYDKKRDRTFEVFPSQFLFDNDLYYIILFHPSMENLVIRDDGAVLPVEKIKKVAVIITAYNTSFINLKEIGGKWVRSNNKKEMKRLSQVLKGMTKIAQSAPPEIKRSINSFQRLPGQILELREQLENCVREGIEWVSKTNDKEITTEDDYKAVRKFNEEMVRCAYRENEIQLKTEQDRKVVLRYLAKKPKKWPLYAYLKFHDMKMLSSKHKEKVKDMEDLKNTIFRDQDLPIEERPGAESIISGLRNPKN